MYQRIDDESASALKGFSYMNLWNEEEFVDLNLGEDTVTIKIDDEDIGVYNSDIPKLIKALQAAYDYKMKGGNK